MKKLLFLSAFLFYSCFGALVYAGISREEILNIPVSFSQNSNSQFSAVCSEYSAVFSPDKVTFVFQKSNPALKTTSTESNSVSLKILNTQSNSEITGEDPLPWKSNYFVGNDQSKWRTKVTNYSKIRIENLYEGIDLVYYGNGKSLKYDFVLSPGENPSKINLSYGSAVSINGNGDLIVDTPFGNIVEKKPYCYQVIGGEKVEVECAYNVTDSSNGSYSFNVATSNPVYPIVIDPEIIFSSYLGVDKDDTLPVISEIDKDGNIYIGGQTSSSDFPVSEDAFDNQYSYYGDIFLMKYNVLQNKLIYSTFFGGEWDDRLNDLQFDDQGNVYLCGSTPSANFPITEAAYDTIMNEHYSGERDGFISKFNSTCDSLIFSTYLGKLGQDDICRIKINKNKEIYFTGYTLSKDFPVTPDAYKAQKTGKVDIFYGKMNSTGSSLIYSSFWGGLKEENTDAILLDDEENVYLIGKTYSSDFPVTSGAYDVSFNGTECLFVTKFDSTMKNIIYSTFIDCAARDFPADSKIDKEGNIYFVGSTYSDTYPVTAGALDTVFKGDSEKHEAFLTKLNSEGSSLVFSTFLGVVSKDVTTLYDVFGIVFDETGNIIISGNTTSADMPLTDGTPVINGESDIFLMVLDPTGNRVKYSTLFGGSGKDIFKGLQYQDGYAYIAGYTLSDDYPVTQNAYDSTYNGEWDIFLTQIYMGDQTSVQAETNNSEYIISNAYPNPFNPSTTISFSIPEKSNVSIDIYNITGQKIKTLINSTMSAGEHSVKWDAGGCSAGLYFYNVKAGKFEKTMRMTLLK